MDPTKVISPKKHLKLVKVIHDGTVQKTGFSIAEIEWDGNPCYGVRWDDSPTPIGYPRGKYGHPQWFVLNSVNMMNLKSALGSVDICMDRTAQPTNFLDGNS